MSASQKKDSGKDRRTSKDLELGHTIEFRSQKRFLRSLKKRSALRRQLISKELGLSKAEHISHALCGRRELDETRRLLYKIHPNKYRATKYYGAASSLRRMRDRRREHGRSVEDDEVADILGEESDDETTYKDSNIFLKGTQSANPHNDYSQHFVDTGQRPQNFIRDVGMGERFEEYPKLKELIRLKDEQIDYGATQPMYLKCDLKAFDLTSLGTKFDVMLIEPPLEEYQRRASGINFTWTPWDWEDIMNLKIEEVAAQRSFLFLWCGSYEGLDIGRECLKKWGFRRCEDICWVKTNIKNPGKNQHLEQKAIFQNTKEHCLMGIKGTVRRNQDGHFIHANIDLDIIITEEPELGSTEKPEEIFHIIQHFCLGRRRLHIFGRDTTIRPGWLTLGSELTSSNFQKELYLSFFDGMDGHLLVHSEEIESLRPKTPPLKRGGGRGRGRGAGRGGGAGGLGQGSSGMLRGGMHGAGRGY